MALCSEGPSLHKRQHWLMIPTSVRRVLAVDSVSPMALVSWMLHITAMLWQHVGKQRRRSRGGFWMSRGGRLHQTCGFLWSSLAGAGWQPTKWSILKLKGDTHSHRCSQGGLAWCLKMWLVKRWTHWSSLGKRWKAALRGFPWESL